MRTFSLVVYLSVVFMTCASHVSLGQRTSDSAADLNRFFQLVDQDSSAATAYGAHLLRLFEEQKEDSMIIVMYYELGQMHITWGNYADATDYFDRLTEFAESIESSEGLAYADKGRGDVAQNQARYDIAIMYFHRATANWRSTGNLKQVGYSLNNIGVCYRKLGDDYRGLKYYLDALEVLKEIQDTRAIAFIGNNIANIYYDQGEIDKAIAYHELVLESGRSLGNKQLIATALINLALSWEDAGELMKAHRNYLEAIQISRQLSDKETLLLGLTNFGEFYRDREVLDSAKLFLSEALQLSRRVDDIESESFALIGLGQVYLALGKLDASMKYTLEGLGIAEKSNQNDNIIEACKVMSQVEERSGHFESALRYTRRYHHLSDSLKALEEDNNLALLQAKHDFEVEQNKVDTEITLLKSENKINELKLARRNQWIFVLLIFIVLVLLFAYLFYRQRLLKREKESQDLKQKLLRLQLNPHFLFNSLNAIQHMVFNEVDRHLTADYLARFSQLTRQILEMNQEDLILLADEVSFANNFLSIQNIRFEEKFEYEIAVDENLDPDLLLIPPMITQPFLENAIEHGIISKLGEGVVKMQINKVSDSLIAIIIEDNGVGRDKAATINRRPAHQSLALRITEDRLKEIRNLTKRKVFMKIEDLQEGDKVLGTRVSVQLPYLHVT